MSLVPRVWRRMFVFAGLSCAVGLLATGCGDSPANSGTTHPGLTGGRSTHDPSRPAPDPDATPTGPADTSVVPADQKLGEVAGAKPNTPAAELTSGDAPATLPADALSADADASATADAKPSPENPALPRHFVVEGPGDALRIGFDDLDLLKIINMEPVTPDCVEKMPGWLRDLAGKHVRIRGYMKPSGLSEGIPEFVFVRSTDLCCFGPKGKVYHLIAVKLKAGTTTDYIELKPFDVAGKFRIEKIELDDGLIFLLYHIDDAAIIRK